jgi:hypothetical protein
MAVWFALLEQPDFRMLFADRAYRHLYNGGALTAAVSAARLTAMTGFVRPAMAAERWRWDRQTDPWEEALAEALGIAAGNVEALIADMRSLGYYPSIDPPRFSRHGGAVPEGYAVTIENPSGAGTVYYALGGADPREAGTEAVSADAVVYGGPIPVGRATRVKARLLHEGEWSAAADATFHAAAGAPELRITEIMYNPPGDGPVSGEEFEFLELKNTGPAVLDLTGFRVAGGVGFVFAEGALLGPGSFAVLVANEAAFRIRYPRVVVSGVYRRNLGNEGDAVVLTSPGGSTVTAVTYGEAAPWPVEADGEGYSLVPRNPEAPDYQDDPCRWCLSRAIGGSPGRDDDPLNPEGGQAFRRGDANLDGSVTIADPVYMLAVLFLNVATTCADTCDVHDDGTFNLSDPIATLTFLFRNGPPPAAPFPACGWDATADTLSCTQYPPCR